MVNKCLVVETYHRLKDMQKTATELRLCVKTVRKILNGLGVKRYGRRSNHFDQHFFDAIDTAEKAYILGLLWADGNNNLKRNTVSLELAIQDVDVLESIRKLVKSTTKLRERGSRKVVSMKTGKIYQSQPLRTLDLYSKHMCLTLEQLGMKAVKAPTLRVPIQSIPTLLMGHFMRGLFDGDGSMNIVWGKGRKKPAVFTSFVAKNKEFAIDVQRVIKQHTGAAMKEHKDGNIYVLKAHALSDQNAIWSWMYQDATLYLERKHDKFLVLRACHQHQLYKQERRRLRSLGIKSLHIPTYAQTVDILLQ